MSNFTDFIEDSPTTEAHVVNGVKHREINDSGFGDIDLWSAEKIADYVVTATGSGTVVSSVQARRTTTYSLTSSFLNITFDVTDEETNVAVIEHDSNNTERINIKSDGIYFIQYNFNINASTDIAQSSFIEAHLVKNDSTTISGSYSKTTTFYDTSIDGSPLFHNQLANSVIATLSDNSYITVQMKYSNSQTLVGPNGTIKIIKLGAETGSDGEKGETGPAGTGTTIDISSNDILTASGIGNLNFAQGLSVIDNGSGKATVSGGSGVSNHGDLTGLLGDDHTQYLLVDGTRGVDGDLVISGKISTTQVHPVGDSSSYVKLASKVISIYTDWMNMFHMDGNAGEIIFNPHADSNDADIVIYGKDGTSTKDAYKYDYGDDIHYFNSNITASGQVYVPDGTNLVPSYSFSSDTDTGMYLSSTDLIFTADGSNILKLDESSDSNRNSLYLYSPNNTKNVQIYSDQLWNVGAINTNAAKLEVWVNGWRQVDISDTTIDMLDNNIVTTGNVGIGTTVLSNPLTVNRSVDGIIVDFESAGVVEGNISILGNTTSYNAFVGSHYTQLKSNQEELPVGAVVISTGEIIPCEVTVKEEIREEIEVSIEDAFEDIEVEEDGERMGEEIEYKLEGEKIVEIKKPIYKKVKKMKRQIKQNHRVDAKTGKIIKTVIIKRNVSSNVANKEYFTYIDTTNQDGDKRVYGVWLGKTSNDVKGMSFGQDNKPVYLIAQVGLFKILVTEDGGNIEIGDYLETSVRPMLAQKQSSTTKINSTIAKALIEVNWNKETINPDFGCKAKLIPCIF